MNKTSLNVCPRKAEDRAVVDKYERVRRKVPRIRRNENEGGNGSWREGYAPVGARNHSGCDTPAFWAKSAEAAGKIGDVFRSLERVKENGAFLGESLVGLIQELSRRHCSGQERVTEMLSG